MKHLYIIGEEHDRDESDYSNLIDLAKQDKIILLREGSDFDLKKDEEDFSYGVEDPLFNNFAHCVMAFRKTANLSSYISYFGKDNTTTKNLINYYMQHIFQLFLEGDDNTQLNTILGTSLKEVGEGYLSDELKLEEYKKMTRTFFDQLYGKYKETFRQSYYNTETHPEECTNFFFEHKSMWDDILKNISFKLLNELAKQYNSELLTTTKLQQFFANPSQDDFHINVGLERNHPFHKNILTIMSHEPDAEKFVFIVGNKHLNGLGELFKSDDIELSCYDKDDDLSSIINELQSSTITLSM